LLYADGLSLLRDEQKCRDFASLSRRRERMEYFSAGIYVFLTDTEHSTDAIPVYFHQTYIKFLSMFIHQFVNLIENHRMYPLFTLRRFANLLEMEATLNRTSGRQPGTADRRIHIETLLEALRMTGLLETCGKDWRIMPQVKDITEIAVGQPERPCIAMDTPFSCILYPEIAFADALTLSSFCKVQTGGHDNTLICFELSRASVIRGFDLGMDAASMLDLLDRLSGHRLDESTGWTLRDWEKRYTMVSLYQGLVLCIAPESRYLAESPGQGTAEEDALKGSRQKKPDSQSGPLTPLIARVLAPGVYLLSVSDKAEALDALEKAGVDIIAQPYGHAKKGGGTEFRRSAYPPPLKNSLPGKVFFIEERARMPEGEIRRGADAVPEAPADPVYTSSGMPPEDASKRSEVLKERFRQTLKERHLSRAEQEELASRIERSMIVNESQLEGVSVRYEKLEARGLDYVGKAAIVKQAIAAKSFVEVFWPGAGGVTQKTQGIPEGLEKSDGGTILLLRVMQEDDGPELIRLPLGKISLIRRIKQSIFED
jgi:hypothetical protein